MLINLSIQDYAVVERLEVDLATGMTCITGETGAGKSIMLDALGLCIGDRADSKAIRPGAARTGLAGDTGHTGRQIDLESLDNGVILYG